MPPVKAHQKETGIDRVVASVGSLYSLIIHSLIFVGFFVIAGLGIVSWEIMLLVLTTLVSLEAIYLAIFIQITVNRHTKSLKEVEEDIDEIQEDVEELGEDLEDIQEDIEEISEDIDEIQEDVEEMNEEELGAHMVKEEKKRSDKKAAKTKEEMLEKLSRDVSKVLADLEALKAGK